MLFLAFLTAVGGGTVRDLIISEPVFWTQNPIYLYLIFVATFSTFFLHRLYARYKLLLLFFDTLGVGIFVVIGTHKTLLAGFNAETAFIMGTISAVLGGILRSAFSREFSILSNRELYATIAAICSIFYIFLRNLGLELHFAASIVVLMTFVIRYFSTKYKIRLPVIGD